MLIIMVCVGAGIVMIILLSIIAHTCNNLLKRNDVKKTAHYKSQILNNKKLNNAHDATTKRSEESKIREMDASELAEYAGRLATKITEETITPDELRYYNIARANYKYITGRVLTEATMTRR